MKKGTMKSLDGVNNLSNPETREKATQASIESRKAGGKNELAGVKQAVTKGMVESMFDCPNRTKYQNKHLTEANLDYLIKAIYDLPKGKQEDKDRWICQFIDSQLKEAKANPNSRAADRLASALFNQSLFDQMDIYLKRASAEDIDFQIYKIRSTLYDKQQEVYDDTIDNNHLIINSRRSGKCWAPGTELRLFNGSLRKVEDIKVGDVLLGPDSQPRHVISLAHGFDEMYRIRSVKDEIVFECNKPHVLTLLRSHIPTRKYKVGELYDMSVEDYLKTSQRDKDAFKLIRASIEYPEQQHAIDPYILGYWLGDGCKNAPTITIGKKELQAVDWFKRNVENLTWNECSQGRCWNIYMKGVLDDFRALGFCNKDYKDNYKYIPDSYKYDSRNNRLKLLAGLIDSDGYYSRNSGSSLEYGTSDKRLRDDVLELCRSLGFHTTVTTGPSAYNGKQCKTAYNITIKGKTTEIPVVLDRKRPTKDSSQCLGYSFTVEPIGRGEYYGFTLEEPDGRCLLADYTITHNTELMGRLLARDLIRTVEIDGRVVQNRCAYINRNSSAAVRQIRDPLLKALEKTNLRIVKGSVENQELYFSNGAMLLILGNNNAADVDKLRGEKFNTIIMDECGHQRNVRHLMREVIGPCLKDYGKDRRLYMVGTPPRIPHTYVEEVYNNWKERGWKLWHWTFQDNPFIPDRASVIPDVCKEQGVSEDSAFIQREYYGRMDVYDDDAKFIKKYTIEEPADIKTRLWDYAWIGVDYGVTDKAAVVSVLADSKSREMFVVDDWSEDGKEVTALCKEIMRQYENLKALNVRRSVQVIADTNNKEISLELHRTYKIPNVALAYKHDKDLALDQLAEWFKTGRIKLSDKAKAVRKDADLMVWERDEETDKIVHKLDDDTYHGNAMFATLYVSRQFDACVLGSSISRTAKDIIESTRHKPYKGEYEENYDEYEHYENDGEHWQDAY